MMINNMSVTVSFSLVREKLSYMKKKKRKIYLQSAVSLWIKK